MSIEKVQVPDIGADSAEVIEILVNVGDVVEADQSLAVLESDKASVEIPCPKAGKIRSIALSVGDQVSEGAELIELEVAAGNVDADASADSVGTETTLDAENSDAGASSEEEAAEHQTVSASATKDSSESAICLVPDIGADEAEIIEVMVSVGESIEEGDSIVVAESDKASVEVPAEFSGVIETLHVSSGDKVSQGDQLVTITRSVSESSSQAQSEPESSAPTETKAEQVKPPILEDVAVPVASMEAEAVTHKVPDIGSDSAEVIEVMVAAGDVVEEGDSICAVETDKASVEVPSPASGKVEAVYVETGTQISQGQDLVRILGTETAGQMAPEAKTESAPAVQAPASSTQQTQAPVQATEQPIAAKAVTAVGGATRIGSNANVYAGPAARKTARELGVELSQVKGSGNRGRILIEDINQFVKERMQSGGARLESVEGRALPEIPAVDWSKFGEIETEPMSRIHKATAVNMVRNWLNVPHVTQFDDADVTELEKYRAYLKSEATSRGIKMTPLAFLLKATAVALAENPKMNSSLHENGEDLVFRKFVHISIAVDTPAGLMVPVIRDVDKKNIWELAADVSTMAGKAKEGKLGAKDMQGASFTISSLGAIGGTGFTPIVSAPQVGILGVSKTSVQPVWNGSEFEPRQMMPLSVSYDHRAVNGVDAGKFMVSLVSVLEDLDRIWNG